MKKATRRRTLAAVGGLSLPLGGCGGRLSALDEGRSGDDTATPPSVEESWPMQGFDAANSGYAPGRRGPRTDPEHRWRRDVGEVVHGSPVVADGTLFVEAPAGRLLALDAATGRRRWVFDLPHSGFDDTAPLATSDAVVHPVFEGMVFGVDPVEGTELWRRSFRPPGGDGESFVRSASRVASGLAYVPVTDDTGDYAGRVLALDPATGETVRRFEVPAGPVGIALDAEPLVVATGDNGLFAFDRRSGERRWRFRPENDVTHTDAPALRDGTAYVPLGEAVYAVDLASGDQRWRFVPGGRFAIVSPAVDGERVYVGGRADLDPDGEADNFHALDPADGSVLWSADTSPAVWTDPVVADDTVYLGTQVVGEGTGGLLYALDAATGETLWRHETKRVVSDDTGTWLQGTIQSAPAVAGGTVFFTSEDQRVHAVGGR